jgi:hypothetical protein
MNNILPKLVWTFDSNVNLEKWGFHSHETMLKLYINYYNLSITSALKLGYECILYTTDSFAKNFNDINVEIIIVDSEYCDLFDSFKFKVLKERNDDYILIDGDVILHNLLPNLKSDVSFERYETHSWNKFYNDYVNNLTSLNISNHIKEWTGQKRIRIMNCGLLHIQDIEFKNLYLNRWEYLSEFINNNILENRTDYTSTSAQYLLTELCDYYNKSIVDYFSSSDPNTYCHDMGDYKFTNPRVPTDYIIDNSPKKLM